MTETRADLCFHKGFQNGVVVTREGMAGRDDEGLPGQILQLQKSGLCERVSAWKRDEAAFRAKQHCLQRFCTLRDPDHRGVDPAVAQLLDRTGRVEFLQGYFHFRPLLAKAREQLWKHLIECRRQIADRQLAALAGFRLPRRLLHPVGLLDQPVGFTQGRFAALGQPDAAPGALEQCDTDGAFQRLDLLAERRLRHAEPTRRAAEIQLFSHRNEGTDMAQFHPFNLLRLFCEGKAGGTFHYPIGSGCLPAQTPGPRHALLHCK